MKGGSHPSMKAEFTKKTQIKTSVEIHSRIDYVENRISQLEDEIQEVDYSLKVNNQLLKVYKWSMGKL